MGIVASCAHVSEKKAHGQQFYINVGCAILTVFTNRSLTGAQKWKSGDLRTDYRQITDKTIDYPCVFTQINQLIIYQTYLKL